jgi:hypothetical protein
MIGERLALLWLMRLSFLMLSAGPLAAHSTPNAEVRLSTEGDAVVADIVIPRGEYAFATGHPVTGDDQSLRIARDYLRDSMTVSTPEGREWTVSFRRVAFVQSNGPPDLRAVVRLVPPAGSSPHELTINWRALMDELPGHFALFIVEGKTVADDGSIVGAVRAGSPPLRVSITPETPFLTLSSAIALGAHHILEGYDHLLFLLVLLLPAPLLAASGRWGGPRSTKATLIRLTQIVTAFTIGHSLTLIAATLRQWSLPVAPVEIAIAVSVLVSAVHALRPLLPGKEALVALVFGLVHGLAFATLVQDAQAGASSSALALLGFNLGIELVQLAIVLAVVPSLLVLSRYPFYRRLRGVLAWFSIAAAVAWIVNRATGLGGDVVASMELVMSHMPWLAAGTTLLAIALVAARYTGRDRAWLFAGITAP